MTRRALGGLAMGVLASLVPGCSRSAPQETKPQVFDSQMRTVPGDHPRVIFTDVTRTAGIDFIHSAGPRTHQLPEDMGSGAAWGDYDGDGFPDLYLVNQPGPWGLAASPDAPTGHLYRNNGDGTFTDVTARAGVTNRGGFGMGAAWGDYDNDGFPDLYVTNYGRSVLYHNNGDGTFTDVTERAGVANNRWGMTAIWFDYDNDGYLDLYVTNYVDYTPQAAPAAARSETQYRVNVPFTLNPASFAPVANRLYHNNHDGTFTDVAARLGVADPDGRSLVASFSDFDLDGRPDLYVGNDISSNRLYRNLGRGRFQDISASSWTEENRGTMGIAIGDFDGDGDNDMFLTHWVTQGDALYQNLWVEQQQRGQLHLSDVADMYGCGSITMPVVGWGTFFFDFDNDGKLDLFVVNGSTLEEPSRATLIAERPFLFWSRGDAGFYDLARSGTAGSALQTPIVGRGAAYADYDGDGDLDVIVTTNHGRPILLRNDGGNRNHWLAIHLRGTRSNRQGVGARLLLTAGGKRQYREYGAGGSYLSQSALDAWFGLGQAGTVEALRIVWPSGEQQVFQNLPIDRVLTITEGSPRVLTSRKR